MQQNNPHRNMHMVVGSCMLGVLLLVSLFIGTSILNDNVMAVAGNHSNVTTRVNVTNTEPIIMQVNMTPYPAIALTPGGQVNVTCRGFVHDYNGWNDFRNASAKFWHNVDSSQDAADDNNTHYSVGNESCVVEQVASSNYTVNCTASLWYYATNGSWNCSLTVYDDGGAKNPDEKRNNTAIANITSNVSQLLAIDTQSVLDYGNMTVASTSNEKNLTITNVGNIPMNVSVRAYGNNTDSYNYSMVCQYNNIPVEYQKYSIYNGTPYADMTSVTNASTQISNITLPVRTNDTYYGNDRNYTYWRLQIPYSVGGLCTGTIRFTAESPY